ncbi:MAG: hypothetical protein WCO56_13755 [Verrucomicrobiota bacterium]
MAKTSDKVRKVLVILTNRFQRTAKPKWFELECKEDGSIVSEIQRKSQPRKAIYDEVWENDDGKTEIDSCNRMSRKYSHALQKPEA